MKKSVLVLLFLCFGIWYYFGRGSGGFLEAPPASDAVQEAESAQRPVLPLETDLKAAEAFVRLGYGLDGGGQFEADSFLTKRLGTVQAQHLAQLVKEYNNYDGERVAAVLMRFRGRVSAVQFGRAASPLLYIDLPHWTHQREETGRDSPRERIADAEHRALVEELRLAFVTELKADSFLEEGRSVRIWWD